MTGHETVELKRSGRAFQIDKGLAPLIELIWKFDLWTINCCQENRPGVAWIEFSTCSEAETFITLVVPKRPRNTKNYDDSLYSRIMGESNHPGKWEFNPVVEDLGVEYQVVHGELETTVVAPPEFQFCMSVRFPVTDIPLLVKALKERLKTRP